MINNTLKGVIITGNPYYVDKEKGKQKQVAWNFYNKVADILRNKGVDISFDPGEPKTSPDKNVDFWIGHSRGGSRLRWAPNNVKTLRLDDYEEPSEYPPEDITIPVEKRRLPPSSHYEVTPEMEKALSDLLQ